MIFKPLANFFDAIRKDARVSITHIGIFVAILEIWQQNGCNNPLKAYSYDIMQVAKISASSTYHKIIRDLHNFGYLRYEPSFKRNQPSEIWLENC